MDYKNMQYFNYLLYICNLITKIGLITSIYMS